MIPLIPIAVVGTIALLGMVGCGGDEDEGPNYEAQAAPERPENSFCKGEMSIIIDPQKNHGAIEKAVGQQVSSIFVNLFNQIYDADPTKGTMYTKGSEEAAWTHFTDQIVGGCATQGRMELNVIVGGKFYVKSTQNTGDILSLVKPEIGKNFPDIKKARPDDYKDTKARDLMLPKPESVTLFVGASSTKSTDQGSGKSKGKKKSGSKGKSRFDP